jgi:site-specific recombinase XerC
MKVIQKTFPSILKSFSGSFWLHVLPSQRQTLWRKILGHSNIKMTERYAKLAKQHIARTSNTAREMWKLLELIGEKELSGCCE